MNIDTDTGWLSGVRRVDSPNCDKRPPGSVLDLIVVHGISLPPGEFGGTLIDDLFTNTLIASDHPYFKKINDLPYYTLSLILKSKIKRTMDNYKDAKDSIDEAFEVSKSLNSAEISNTITIEKLLIEFISKNSNELINKLLIVSKQNISNEHKAYIHYNIWKNTSDDESKLISLKLYKNEFKKYPKYQYTIFIDEMS